MMSSAFLVVVALMVIVAIALVIYPLLRRQPVTNKGEPAAPRAAPLAFALAVAVGLGAIGLYAKLNTFPWDNPMSAEAVPAGHGEIGSAGAMCSWRPAPIPRGHPCSFSQAGLSPAPAPSRATP